MSDYDLVIRNAKVVTEDRQLDGDIAVKDGRVVALEPAIAGSPTSVRTALLLSSTCELPAGYSMPPA